MLKIRKLDLKSIFFVVLCIVFTIEMNPTFQLNTTVRYLVIAISIGLTMLRVVLSRNYKIKSFIIWCVCIMGYSYISTLWSIDPQLTVQSNKNFLITLIICLVIFVMVENSLDFRRLWNALLTAFVIDSIYVLSSVGIANIGEYRIGVQYSGLELWNANSIGAFTSVGCVMLMYMFQQENKKVLKVLFALLAVFMGLMTFNTGSRKAFILIIGVYVLYMYLLDTGNKRMRNILLIFISTVLIWTVITSNESLSELIGDRVISMIQELTGTRANDNSMSMRMLMIVYGIQYFVKKPFIGYGLGCYTTLSVFQTYAHNNFIELLVGLGFVGTLLYYSVYVVTIRKGVKNILIDKREPIGVFCLSMTIILLINHMAMVSYYDPVYNCTFMLLVTYLGIQNKRCTGV